MYLLVLADSSVTLGHGHVMRTLALAGELKKNGAKVEYLSSELPGDMVDNIEKVRGYKVYRLPISEMNSDNASSTAEVAGNPLPVLRSITEKNGKLDWLVIDNYSVNERMEMEMKEFVDRILVIEDVANRKHHCDILLDQNYSPDGHRYDSLVPPSCLKLLGPRYALLRPEFSEAAKRLTERDGNVKRILLFFGGSDRTNETSKALKAIRMLNRPDISVDVVIGASNPHRFAIEKLASTITNVECHFNADNMRELMLNADVSVGAGGSTTWERCCMGLPSVVTEVAENQSPIAEEMAKAGMVRNLGWYADVDEELIFKELTLLIKNPALLVDMSKKCMEMVDGLGSKRVCEEVLKSE